MEELSALVLGIRVPQDSFRRVEIRPVNLEGPVDEVKAEAIKQTGLEADQILLVYAGVALEDNNSLTSYGIISGVMIHVLKKKEREPLITPRKMSDKECQRLALAFRTFALNAGFRSTLTRLNRPEVLENIVMATPGLSQDPIAVAIIRDPELLGHMGDMATIRRVVEKHPVLAEAANYIAAAVHEDAAASTVRHSRRGESTRASSTFSLDNLSGEEMDSSQSSDSPPARSSSSSQSGGYSGLTSSQLAAALAIAAGNTGEGASSSNNGASGSRSAGSDSSMLITPEMFNSALQQAFQGMNMPVPGGSPTAGTPTSRGSATENPLMMAERMSQQLQQMRELGLRDQMFNMQALQITNGDVQAAIELVISSGPGGPDNDEDADSAFN